ncbi:CBD9-like protein [Ascobolus immersus RN42]|uniref:CBD9-like protein n=1 Tax=Ascobolus immersus RN42 TaxID=1160509 RepID=A0A3N4HK94_ASCIM|nr:CBD9-like protein [Ascobolus immersus RN42]
MKLTFLSTLLAAATAVSAQQSVPFTHPQTGLRFQSLTHPSSASSFGIALPPAGGPSNEFIGQISARLTSGWMGVSFGGAMLNNLLLTAWQNGNSIVHSLRLTPSYGNPAPYTRAGPVVTPICTSTQTNSTHWTFTFLCTNCNSWTLNNGQPQSIDLTGDFQVMGYAGHTSQKPTSPAQPGSAIPKHLYQGQFGMNFQAARVQNWDAYKLCQTSGGGQPTTSTYTPPPTTSTYTPPPTTSTYTPPPTTTTYTPPPTPTPSQPTCTVARYGQCGGSNYSGCTNCASGSRCNKQNDWYSQCI